MRSATSRNFGLFSWINPNADSALLNCRLRSKSSASEYTFSINCSSTGHLRNLSSAISSWPCCWNARPSMRFDSAPAASDCSLPRSVIKKRLVVSSRWPITSSAAGSISFTQMPGPIINAKWVPSSTTKMPSVNIAAGPARKRGNSAIRYAATNASASSITHNPHVGVRKKCCCKIDDTECAIVCTGESKPIGVTVRVPTPAAVAPMSTILSLYFAAGIFPV